LNLGKFMAMAAVSGVRSAKGGLLPHRGSRTPAVGHRQTDACPLEASRDPLRGPTSFHF